MLKRFFALFLAMSMVFSMLPVSAFAADDEHVMETIEETEVPEEVTEEVTVPEETEAPIEETEPAEEEPAQPEETEEVPVIEEPEETPDEEPENEAAVQYEHITWINPLYRDVVTEDDLIPYEPGQIVPFASTAVYSTVDQAGAYVRSLMVRRESAVSFSLRSTSTDYDALFEGIMASAEAHTGNPKEGDYLKFQYAGWSGGLSISGDVMTFDIAITYYTTAAQEAKVDTAVANVLNSLNLDGQTPYERTCRIYKYICDHVTYDYAHLGNEDYKLQFTAYAALMNGTSVCQGYAVLLYRLALESGIECRVIPGIGNGGPHAWNILKLGNNYYNMDATWDADRGRTVDSFVYFLRCNANFPDHYRETEYTTAQFNTAYPMASKDYSPETTSIVASGNCGDNLTWTLDVNGTLTISGIGAMNNITLYELPWYSRRSLIKTVMIEDGVTSIGFGAFYECSSLSSITIPDSVTSISKSAFSGCSSLTSITIPNSVTSIGDSAFSLCSSLTSVMIGSGVTSIGDNAFWYCGKLHVTFAEGTTKICDKAFYDCSSLSSITIPDSVTSIGSSAFYLCSKLASIRIPVGVTSIGDSAFSGCSSLTSITLPDSVTSIGDAAFYYCSRLKSITIPDKVKTIGNSAFGSCSSLTSITIPDGVTSIGSYAFYECSNLTSATIGSGVTSIGDKVFYNCSSLKEIYFSGNMPSIGSDAFSGVNAKVYYPCGNTTWKSSLLLNYGGSLEWIKNHNYAATEVVPATCTEQGYTKHTCVICADSYWDTFTQPTGHTEVVDKAVQPTCTEAGKTEGKHCSVCKAVIVAQKVIPANGHTEVIDKAVEATCTEAGKTEGKHCSVCNAVIVAQKVIPAKGHTEVIDKGVPATCTTAGVSDGKHCSVCKAVLVEQKVIPASGHTEVVDKAVAPTCTKDGLTEGKHCSTCGTVLVAQRTIPANGHTEVVDKAVAATCTEAGKTEGKHCSVCGAVLVAQKTIPATGHTEVVDRAVAATCTEAGKTEGKHCSVCNAVTVAQKTIPATGHTEVIDKGVPATCTTPGVTDGKHCSVCKVVLVEQKVIPATGHTEVVDKAVAPTCTKDGLTEGKHCSTCGTVLVAQRTIPANGHTEVVDKAVAATCTEAGKTEGKHCSVCNTVLVAQKTIPATGHTEVVDKAVEPTCTEDGKTQGKHCSVCNAVTVAQKTIPATGHTEVTDKGTPATCTAPGVTDGKHCSVCKAVLVEQKVIPAKGHTEVVDQAVAATCTETGLTEGKHCSVCKEVLVKQEVVPATGHTVVTDPAVDATCTEDGKTAGKHCFVCGTVLEEQETVKALGHDYVGTATAPTCTEEGYTTFTCTRCADSFVTYRVPALGHYYNGWLSDSESHWQRCTVCGENTEKIAHTPDRPEATSDADQLCEICGYVMQSKHTIVRISGPATLKGGASATYTAKVEAAAPLADSTILWKLRSEDAAFASITAAGKLTTKAVAESVEIVITAYAKADPKASANYTVTLVPAAASAVIEGAHYVNMAEGKTIQLTGKVLPASAMQEGTWKSSAVKVAKVDANGLVTFLKAGTVTITFTASDGSKKAASVKITAGEPVTGLTITGAETLASGSKTTLKAAPAVKGLAWSSSNPAAATVSSTGAVTAKTVYENTVVTITAETTDGSNVKAEHTITITPKAKDMAIRKEGKIVSGKTLYVDSDAGFLFLEAPEGSKWTSSAAKVAEVNDGIVKILKAGTATITAKSADGKQSAKVTLKISKLVNTMTLTASGETTLISGKGKVTIKAAVNSDAKTKTVTWASSDPSVASVSTTGVVTAKAGVMKNTEVTITATAKDGSGVTESIKVTVIPAATAVSIRSESAVTTADGISIRVGETLNGRTITLSKDVKIDLGAKVFPNALGAYADQTVTWKSSAAKVATVSADGVVTALKAGTVTITVKTADGKTNTVKIKFV